MKILRGRPSRLWQNRDRELQSLHCSPTRGTIMKQLLVLLVGCCLLPVGCTSTSSMPSRFTSSLFGKKSSDHTLAQDDAGSKPAASEKLSLTSTASNPLAKGEEALKSGNLREAKKQFQKLVQEDPNHATAHHRLAYIADMNEEYSIAEIHYLAALRIQPKNADIACDLGYSYLLRDKYEDAERYLEKALTFDPQHHYAKMNLATLHSKRGDYGATLAMLRQAVSEEEAQAHMAQLFPNGPPDGTQLAKMREQEIAPATRELQQKLAQRSKPPAKPQQQQPIAQAKRPKDLHNMDPREIPPEMINDMFAQIDQEADRSRLSAPPISPSNGDTPRSQQGVHTYVNHEEPSDPAFAAQPFPSSIPGDLPTSPKADPYSEYAVIGPPPRDPRPTSSPQTENGQNSPYFQPEDMVRMGQHESTPATNGGILPAGGMPPARASANQTRPAAGAMPDPYNRPAGTHPFAHLPEVGQTSNPATDSNPSPSPNPGPGQTEPSSLSYQDAMAKALQMGMSAGPGQMFPADVTGNAAHSSNRPVPSGLDAIRPLPSLPPMNSAVSQPLPPGNPSLPQLSDQQPLPGMSELSKAGAAMNAPGSVDQPQRSGLDLPASPQLGTPATGMQDQIRQTSGESAGVESETPWFDNSVQTTQSNRQPLPERSPQPNYHEPQQWPHSPQSETSNSNYAPIIHRGVQPGNAPPAQQQNSLPQVVPGVR